MLCALQAGPLMPRPGMRQWPFPRESQHPPLRTKQLLLNEQGCAQDTFPARSEGLFLHQQQPV